MADDPNTNLEAADIVIIVLHFLIVFSLGLWVSWRAGNKNTTSGYFLAGRDMSWWLVGLSLYVSNIGSSSFIGLASSAAASGYAVIAYEFHGIFCLLLLGFIFVPVYFASGITTVPEYLKKRFGGERLQVGLSVINLFLLVLASLSAEMYAGSIIIREALGWNIYLSTILLLALTAIYTVAGGLKAVIITDALQTVVMVTGAFILMGIAINEIGGLDNLRLSYMTAIPNTTAIYGNTSCGIPTGDAFHIFRDASASNPNALPWPGVVFGIFLLSAWYFCTNQVIVQRTLAAANLSYAKSGCILAGYCKILPFFLMIIPGMISRSLWPDEVGCVDPDVCEEVCGNPNGCSNIAYPRMLIYLMPTGLKGLMLAAMLAALMSSLTSIFNSASSMFVIDIWLKIRPSSTELELVIAGKLCTIILVVVSVLWLPVIEAFGSGELFVYIQSISSYFSPTMFALYTAAILSERINEAGAFYGLVCGFIIGLSRAICDIIFGVPGCGQEDDRPAIVKNFHYLHFACFLYGAALFFIVAISLITKPIESSKLIRLTWWTKSIQLPRKPMSEEEERKDRENEAIKAEKMKELTEKAAARTSFLGKSWNFLCSIDTTLDDKPPMTEKEKMELERKLTSIEEKPLVKKIVAWNAVLLCGVGVFLFAFYG
ncbi:sodium/glucose cotransporter 4-like [Lytechinus pictus]|uniref:sodium/glucose cotransporter 4-like n=1 Tax=Lytechinus pictus TaxID=7653 RepID=UPI0030B9DE34